MTCSSCPNSPVTPSVELVPEPLPVIPKFETKGSLQLTNTGNAFTDLAPVIPFAISAINAYITSLAVQKNSLEPTFFNSPYLYSLSNNLVLGNYLESSFTEGILTATTYLVPYQSEFRIETATIVTFFNSETKILFFQIPKEFSYNSLELAAVATGIIETGYHAKVQVPQSFIDKTISTLGQVVSVEVDIPNLPLPTNGVVPFTDDCKVNQKSTTACSKKTQSECGQYYSTNRCVATNCEWNGSYCSNSGCSGIYCNSYDISIYD